MSPVDIVPFEDRHADGIARLSTTVQWPSLTDPEKETLTAYGAFGEKKLYGKVVQGVIRSTVVVDEAGVVELAQYNVKATGHVAKLRRDLGLAS